MILDFIGLCRYAQHIANKKRYVVYVIQFNDDGSYFILDPSTLDKEIKRKYIFLYSANWGKTYEEQNDPTYTGRGSVYEKYLKDFR